MSGAGKKIFMNKLLAILSFLWCFSASATNMHIGTGSGTITQNSMGTMVAGDTLFIKTGSYAGGGQFSNMNNITIINEGGIVTFTASFDFGNVTNSMVNIKWTGTGSNGNTYGFVFDATGTFGAGPVGYTTNSGIVFTATHYTPLRIDHIWFKSISSNCIDISGGNQPTYNGTTASLRVYLSTFSYCRTDNCLEFLQGSYSANTGFIDSIDISNNIFNQTSFNGLTVNIEATNFNIHDNQAIYSGYNAQTNDVGVFSIEGFGQIHHNYMKGGRGWLGRISGCSFKGGPVGTFYGHDNIKIGTNTYGMFDMRSDSLNFFGPGSPFFQHCNFQVTDNTAGNMYANDANGTGSGNNFNTPIALFYVMDGGATGFVKNNLAFNTVFGNSGGNVVISFAAAGFANIDTSNNKYFTAGNILNALTDTTAFCAVKTGASIIAQGINIASVPTDYVYYTFANPRTVGAREYQTSAVTCNAGSNQVITLPPTNSVTLDGSASTNYTTQAWSNVSNPVVPNIVSPTSISTSVTGLSSTGTYVFRLLLNGTTPCTVTIQSNAHSIPTVSAGLPQTITSPTNSVSLVGTSTPHDGASISTNTWTKTGGTGTAYTITSPNSLSTTITGLGVGAFVFTLTSVDSYGGTNTSTVTITVNPQISACPNCVVANASGRFYKKHVGKFFY